MIIYSYENSTVKCSNLNFFKKRGGGKQNTISIMLFCCCSEFQKLKKKGKKNVLPQMTNLQKNHTKSEKS